MQTTESIKRRIKSAGDLLSVVKTMKALAAVSIRQYQRAVESLTDYNRAVEMGLQIVLKERMEPPAQTKAPTVKRLGRHRFRFRSRIVRPAQRTDLCLYPGTYEEYRRQEGKSYGPVCRRAGSRLCRGCRTADLRGFDNAQFDGWDYAACPGNNNDH